ncbi:hypothetical protein APED_23510 [Acanthopleuribacter pedis]
MSPVQYSTSKEVSVAWSTFKLVQNYSREIEVEFKKEFECLRFYENTGKLPPPIQLDLPFEDSPRKVLLSRPQRCLIRLLILMTNILNPKN